MQKLYFNILLCVIATVAQAQWTTSTLSQARSNSAATTNGTKIFFGGGWTGSAESNVVDIFDTSTSTWSTSALSVARDGHAATSVGTKVFFAGGYAGSVSNVVDIFNTSTNTWSTATLTVARDYLSAASVGTKVFFAGGYNGTSASYNTVDIYDNSTNVWSTAVLSQARSSLAAAAVGTKVLFAGGVGATYSNVVDIYDNSTNTWSTATLSQARKSLAATSLGTKVFFAGGMVNSNGTYSNVVDIYDNSTNTWTTATLSQARQLLTAVAVGTKVLFAGGDSGNGNSNFSSVVDIYDNNTNTWSTSTLSQTKSYLASAAVGNKALIAGGYNGSQTNSVDVYTAPPSINSFTPMSGPVGTSVTISGISFSTTLASNIVKFNGTTATVTGSTSTSITTSVPTGATTGPITVTVGGQTATSATNFFVGTPTTPTITSSNLPSYYDNGSSLTASITVDNAAKVSKVVFYYSGISKANSTLSDFSKSVLTPSGNTFSATIPTASLTDAIGELYDFKIYSFVDTAWANPTDWDQAHLHYPKSSSPAFTGLSFGDKVSDYHIVSVPLDLKNRNVTDVFSALGTYTKSNWRLFQYSSGANKEYPAFTTVDVGRAYWLIARNQVTISPGEGTTVQLDANYDYKIDLAPGWNLIGNPFNFRVSWKAVLSYSGSPSSIGNFKVFKNGSLSVNDILEPYQGGFVNNTAASTVTVKITSTRDLTLGGRLAATDQIKNAIDQQLWEVNFTMTNGEVSNQLCGIGMNPSATLIGKDPQDEVCVPLPDGLNLFELRYPHPELHEFFSKEVVPTQNNFRWTFDVANLQEDVQLKWDNSYFGNNSKQLVLFNPITMDVIDMRSTDHTQLNASTKKLDVIYGDAQYVQRILENELPLLGNAYPNPAHQEATIPFRVPEAYSGAHVTIQVFNDVGDCVGIPVNENLKDGVYETKWQGKPGMYFVKMNAGAKQSSTIKIVIY